jgi:hypothetical protein
MAGLDDQLLTMEFELAFEVEKAVLNGDLEPFEIRSLGSTIHALSSTAEALMQRRGAQIHLVHPLKLGGGCLTHWMAWWFSIRA